jgi:hypothetical protein
MISVPFFFSDDLWLNDPARPRVPDFLRPGGLKVFNFHPIHLFLNSDCQARYQQAKPWQQDCQRLNTYVNRHNYGAKNFFLDLTEAARARGLNFGLIREIELKSKRADARDVKYVV